MCVRRGSLGRTLPATAGGSERHAAEYRHLYEARLTVKGQLQAIFSLLRPEIKPFEGSEHRCGRLPTTFPVIVRTTILGLGGAQLSTSRCRKRTGACMRRRVSRNRDEAAANERPVTHTHSGTKAAGSVASETLPVALSNQHGWEPTRCSKRPRS